MSTPVVVSPPRLSPEQVAAVRAELAGIMEQVPVYTEMAQRLKRAQDDLGSGDMDQVTALHSAVGALVYCQIAQFETGIKNMAQRAGMLEQVLKQVEDKPMVTPATMVPKGPGTGRFGR